MNRDEITQELNKMPQQELVENLAYLINEMEEKEQKEFLGITE